MKPELETRSFDIELRADPENPMRFAGQAIVFNKLSEAGVGAPGGEIISAGALNKTLAEQRDIFLLYAHSWEKPLASTGSGTLELGLNSDALEVRANFVDTTYSRDAAALVASGVVAKMSAGFRVTRQRMETRALPTGGSTRVRLIDEMRLSELSIVPVAAYPQTSGEMRSLFDLYDELRAGRILSKDNEASIRAAIAYLEGLIAQLGDDPAQMESETQTRSHPVANARAVLELKRRGL
jgi:HK97 family phage prohead protease